MKAGRDDQANSGNESVNRARALSHAELSRPGQAIFYFHTKRQLSQFARSTLQREFCKAHTADDTESPVAPLDKHPAFAAWSALNVGS